VGSAESKMNHYFLNNKILKLRQIQRIKTCWQQQNAKRIKLFQKNIKTKRRNEKKRYSSSKTTKNKIGNEKRTMKKKKKKKERRKFLLRVAGDVGLPDMNGCWSGVV